MRDAESAVRVWQVLIGAAAERRTLTYRLLGERVGLAAHAVPPPLALVARYCAVKQWPPLTVLVVQAGDGRPAPGFPWATDPDGAREAVYEHEWFKQRPPSAGDFAVIEGTGVGSTIG